MKHQSVASLLRYVAVAAFLLVSSFSYSQVLTPRPTSVSGTCGGYYEYLPQGYSSNTWQSYPLIVAVHGIGEIGNGTTDLGNLLNCWTAIPRLIANGGFPNSFNVGGQNFSFIVIAPQFNQWPYASDVNAVVDYAVSHYRVDQSRIYVTGLSMGGGSVWDFAGNYPTKAAAVVPVCGAASSDPTRAQAIANAKLPVWATHNQNDPTVSVSNTTGWVSLIGQYGWNIQSTIFNASGHDAWTQTYDPNFTQNGVNVYQWMLMHQKGTTTTSTPPPPTSSPSTSSLTANAGPTQNISSSSTSLSGSGTTSGSNYIAFYQWSQSSGPNKASFSSFYASNPTVSGLTSGTYTFSLQVTDNTGAKATSNVTVNVTGSSTSTISSGTPVSGSTIHVEAENWTNKTNAPQSESTTDAGGGLDMGYIGGGDWMNYSVSPASAGTYAMNFRVASPNGAQLQVKNSSGTVLATVAIPATGGWQSWQTVTANVTLPAGGQTLTIYASTNGWNFNWFEIAGAGSGSTSSTSTTSGGTTHIEAENYANMNGVVKEGTSDVGGGQDVGYIDYGDWMDYNVNASAAGTYSVNLRVASPTGGQLQIKNSSGTVLATVSVPATGGWQTWQTVSTNISLSAGSQTVRVYSTSNGWNFNWWEISGGSGTVSAASVGKAEVVSTTLSTAAALSVYPNPITDRFQLQINNDLTGSVQVQVYDIQGALQKQFSLSKPDAGTSQFYLSIGKLSAGSYIIKVTMNGWTDSKQVIKK